LATVRHERFKNGDSLDVFFTFLCIVSRTIDNVSFDGVVDLACKCIERVDCNNLQDVNSVLDAVHVVFIEAISFYSTMPKNLVQLMTFTQNSVFGCSPVKVIELWTSILHWSRSTKTDLLWQQLSVSLFNILRISLPRHLPINVMFRPILWTVYLHSSLIQKIFFSSNRGEKKLILPDLSAICHHDSFPKLLSLTLILCFIRVVYN
jgi:hypothetical protein